MVRVAGYWLRYALAGVVLVAMALLWGGGAGVVVFGTWTAVRLSRELRGRGSPAPGAAR